MQKIQTQVHKLNESYSYIDGSPETLKNIFEFLKIEKPMQFGRTSFYGYKGREYEYFANIQNHKLLIMNGHMDILGNFGIDKVKERSDYLDSEIDEFYTDVLNILPFTPYDFQYLAFAECIQNYKQINKMCTGSGKSLTISLIAEFMRRQGKKGLLLVPNINLLTQFKNDIKDYNLTELYDDTHLIGGGNSDKNLNSTLTISTWQSMMNYKEDLNKLDYVICDELHKFASCETSSIVKETINCRFKWGFTGTIPEDAIQKMLLFGLFGLPKTYIRSSQLIERGLATPIKINSVIFKYSKDDYKIFKETKAYPKQLAFIKEHEKRNEFIVNLSCKLKGNTLTLFQHTEHGKNLFTEIMKKKYPDVVVENKNITGKKSFEFQEQYGVYFLNGEDDAKTRERTRKILEEHDNAILVANFALLSTGVNIKKLHNLILASPLKSYTTITQSIGRLMRLHPDKKESVVFDLIDDFGYRKPGGIFYKQYVHRKNTSYNSEEFPVNEIDYNLF